MNLTGICLCDSHVAEIRRHENRQSITEWKLPMSSKDILKYRVFSDFWERGYFLTGGGKFGGDFLIYPGILMRCSSSSLVQNGLMGCNVPIYLFIPEIFV